MNASCHTRRGNGCLLAGALALALAATPVWCADDAADVDDGAGDAGVENDAIETLIVTGQALDEVGMLLRDPVDAVFGFAKALALTPRSATSLTIETIKEYGITEIDDFVALSAGSFTQSFFGVSGSLDLRGTSGETYFNGIRRLDNPGNYTTPIAAADRVDIVRGPASVIYGPSKIGGYMNFIPKSARADTGQFLSRPVGAVSFTGGSWSKALFTAEVGGPGRLGARRFGYYLFGEVEASGSHYRNTGKDDRILQASFNIDVTDTARIAVGGMYHDYQGNQVAGWNRLTQALIDDGIYVTGSAKPLDTDGDGFISHQEYATANGGAGLFAFIVDPAGLAEPPSFGADFALDPATVGVGRLDTSQTTVDEDDTLESEDLILYLDFIVDGNEQWTLANKLYYESYDTLNETTYGFSQFADSWVVENQLIVGFSERFGGLNVDALFSPSIRHTSFEHADDFTNEHFDRRDITRPASALDRRLLATRINKDFTEYYQGDHTVYGLAVLTDLTFESGVSALLGARYDAIDMNSRQPAEKVLSGNGLDASDREGAFSWTASLSWATPLGLVPYVTASEQTTVVVGQGADITADNINDGNAVASSELLEVGVKGTASDDRLFFQAIYYEQERIDFSAQSTVTNQASKTEGFEFELRWLATTRLMLTAAYTNIEVVNLSTLNDGGRFSFLGAGDLPGTAPSLFYGGTVAGFVTLTGNPRARRAGVPENIASFSGIYDFENGLRVFGSLTDVDSVYSGFAQTVKLPAYTLVNAGLKFERGSWSVTVTGKNLTDERYFRANFPNLFGSVIALPELPRHYQARIEFKF